MISEKVLNGLPLDDIYIFDAHGHYGTISYMRQNDCYDGIVSTLDQLGVNAICVSTEVAFETDNTFGNNQTLEATKKHPGRIYGYAVPTPWYDSSDFEGFIQNNPSILGIKIHASLQKSNVNDPGYIHAYEIADKYKLPVLFHAWSTENVIRVADIADKYKDAPMILSHVGFLNYDTKLKVIDAMKKHDNIFIDTAISSSYEGALEWIVHQVGADRVLYGSDIPFFDCRHNLGKIALSKLSEMDKLKILSENSMKIFRLPNAKETV